VKINDHSTREKEKEFLLKDCITYALTSIHCETDVNLRETPVFTQNAALQSEDHPPVCTVEQSAGGTWS
jgi:hypothetical protein